MKQEQGFTLVELLASVAIFTVITSVAVFNNSQFNSTVLLTNLTYEIALSVRQAQVYGITVKHSYDPLNNNFNSGYGIHFDTSSPTSFVLFEDKSPQDHIYNAGEAVETFNIQKGNKISRVAVFSGVSTTTPAIVDISFLRPNPDTWITANSSGSPTYNRAEICVSSPQNIKRKAVIESTGQISVTADTSGTCN